MKCEKDPSFYLNTPPKLVMGVTPRQDDDSAMFYALDDISRIWALSNRGDGRLHWAMIQVVGFVNPKEME